MPTGIVVVLGTGGTIAGVADASVAGAGYRSAVRTVQDLAAAAGLEAAGLETEQVAQLDSKDMDAATWVRLALAAERHLGRADVTGVVVTHGTDTLEETAWFLARVVGAAGAKPLVLTAAMRPADAADADGPRNLRDAVTVARTARARGVVVVMAGVVHAARHVRKAHPTRIDAFTSGTAEVVGVVADAGVRLVGGWPSALATTSWAALGADEARPWPRVEIVTSTAAASGRIVELLVDDGVDGIVVAAAGNGEVHRDVLDALSRAAARGVAVRRATRCLDGAIVEAGSRPFASAGDLTPVKARIDLLLELMARRH